MSTLVDFALPSAASSAEEASIAAAQQLQGLEQLPPESLQAAEAEDTTQKQR